MKPVKCCDDMTEALDDGRMVYRTGPIGKVEVPKNGLPVWKDAPEDWPCMAADPPFYIAFCPWCGTNLFEAAQSGVD